MDGGMIEIKGRIDMARKQPNPKPDSVEKPNPPPVPPKDAVHPKLDTNVDCRKIISKRTLNKGPTIAALTEENEKLKWEIDTLSAQLNMEQDTRDKQASSLKWYREEVCKLTDWKFNRSLWQRIKEVFVYG